MNTKDQAIACSTHPDAPHGFNRNSSHTAGRYVCDCEGWVPDEDNDKPTPDCRTCEWFAENDAGYVCLIVRCTNGDKYQPAPKVVLWKTK